MKVDLLRVPARHPLSPYVRSIFRLRARDAYVAETMLPRASVSILFNFGPVVRLGRPASPDPAVAWKAVLVGGLRTRPLVAYPDRDVSVLGVSLKPDTCFAILRTPLDGLANACADASLLWPDADALLNRLGDAPSFSAQCELLLAWLARAAGPDDAATRIVATACALLGRGPSAGAVGRTAQRIGVSHRHLHRLFSERIGVSPVRYAQLTRFDRALPLMTAAPTLTDLAARTGYFDHAHFCHDFRTFAGMTPDEYRKAGAQVPGHIFSA